MSQKNVNILKKIKLVITDVDGVLTDGGMYYSNKGGKKRIWPSEKPNMKKLRQILT